MRQDVTTSVVMAMDWSVFEEAVEDRPPLLEDLLSSVAEAGTDAAVSSDDLLSQLASANAAEREALLVSFLQQELQAVLRLPSAPAPNVGFFDLGMDSLMAVELRNRLNRALAGACTVSNTVVFDYPDIEVLAQHLDGELGEVDAVAAPQAQPARRAQPAQQPSPQSQPSPQVQRSPQPQPQPAPQVAPPPAGLSGLRRDQERIAVIGMACRFPGSPDLSAYWRQLEAGTDAVTDGRREPGPWSGIIGDPGAEDASYRRGGFIEGLDRFDAKFFGIRTIEARMMDPRQRMLLETSWHALEDAGIDPAPLKGGRAGVFAGLGSSEYRDLISAAGQDDSYLGTAASVAIGRVAFALGLMGPAVPLDMTCAASLVAVHQAAASLRQGEVDLALAGGVHVILSPPVMRFMREYGMLSRTGQCRTFDAAADGFVRGEGCGMVVLKRLSDAEADGDRIWGVIQGSAVNQNGAAAALTVPNGTAQERLFEEALSQAGIAPSELDYLEVHGTGSELGDPIEVRAVAEVYGRGRDRERPLLLGTVKTNIGHLESAAGVAGLIKVLLAMRRGVIPKHLHFENPNPHIEWDKLPVRVTAEQTAWPPVTDRQPIAGISAFGISGTNAHLLVEGYATQADDPAGNGAERSPAGSAWRVPVRLPEALGDSRPAEDRFEPRRVRLLPLSGKSAGALRELADRYLGWLDAHAERAALEGGAGASRLADMAWTAAVGRSHFEHRAGVVFEDAVTLREGLGRVADKGGVTKPQSSAKPALVYSGESSEWASLAAQLHASEPVARAVLERCHAVLREARGISLLDAMSARTADPADPVLTQSAAYALQCALTALWGSVGISPGVVCGCGVGEIGAAQAAGVFGLEAGARLAMRRGGQTGAGGSDSAPGDPEPFLGDVAFGPAQIPVVSGVTGRTIESGATPDGSAWRAAVSGPADCSAALATLADLGVGAIVEVGPASALGPMAVSDWPKTAGRQRRHANAAAPPVVLSGERSPLAPGAGSQDRFVQAVAQAYEAGFALDFAGLFAGETRRRISVPGYPFQRRSFWFKGS